MISSPLSSPFASQNTAPATRLNVIRSTICSRTSPPWKLCESELQQSEVLLSDYVLCHCLSLGAGRSNLLRLAFTVPEFTLMQAKGEVEYLKVSSVASRWMLSLNGLTCKMCWVPLLLLRYALQEGKLFILSVQARGAHQ